MKLAEAKLARDMEVQKQAELKRELARLAQMDERQRRVECCRRRLVELLTDACPRCQAAFVDFDDCFALTCARCPCGFCAWCLADCGADAHRHVAHCDRNLEPNKVPMLLCCDCP